MKGLVLAALAGAAISPAPWSTATPLPERLQELHAAVLHGKIYVAGGIDSQNAAVARAYRYDPAANRWERIADLPGARHHMPLAVAGDSLYAIGGLGPEFNATANLWLYREDRNAWEPRASLPSARGASAIGVADGRIVVVGGIGPVRLTLADSTLIYDPGGDRWRAAAPPPTRRDHLAAAAVGGLVYAIGGRPVNPDRNFDVVEAFNPATGRWSPRAPMPSRRGGLEAAVLGGSIHTFGGEFRSGVFANHEVYDPAANRWSTGPALPTPRHGLAVAAVGGRIYVIGGGPRAGFSQTDVVEVYAPGGTMAFTLTSSAFAADALIPKKHTCDGTDVSPRLTWSGPPAGTAAYALINDDPDAPRPGGWVHWVLYDLPASALELPENVPKRETLPGLGGARQGKNDFGRIGFNGSCPGPGKVHHYHFRLYALDTALGLSPGATRSEVEAAMRDHVLGITEVVGVYERH
jgi:Raf kinase inhibitor-like YbhB/YbcL family protein